MRKFTLLLVAFLLLNNGLKAQIINGGFEDWRIDRVYEEPSGIWGAYNNTLFQPVTKSTDHFPVDIGNYSVRIENDTTKADGIHANGYGILMSNPNFGAGVRAMPNFPITDKPKKLCGYYKFFPDNQDTMEIAVFLYKEGSVVANGILNVGKTISDWTSFSIPISDYSDADSACIYLAAMKPAKGLPQGKSVLYVDNVSFDTLVTTSIINNKSNEGLKYIYPCPASDFVIIKNDLIMKGDYSILIYNNSGVLVQSGSYDQAQEEINVSKLGNGFYSLVITSKNHSVSYKLVIQK